MQKQTSVPETNVTFPSPHSKGSARPTLHSWSVLECDLNPGLWTPGQALEPLCHLHSDIPHDSPYSRKNLDTSLFLKPVSTLAQKKKPLKLSLGGCYWPHGHYLPFLILDPFSDFFSFCEQTVQYSSHWVIEPLKCSCSGWRFATKHYMNLLYCEDLVQKSNTFN